MPRARHAQGRPDTRVIPLDWNETHAPVSAKASRGLCTLRQPGTVQVWDEDLEQNVPVPHEAYAADVVCRVQALGGQARQITTADHNVTVADYLVVVPLEVGEVREGHLALVTETGDPALDGRVLRVEQVSRGTERFERDLFCVLAN